MADKITTSLAQAKVLVMEGQAGYSPQITVEPITGGHRVTITSKVGDVVRSDSFDVMDGDGASEEVIAAAVMAYLEHHPITAAEIEYICRSADDDSRSASPTYAEVVGKWDRLRESYPNNITKETIGQDSGGNNIWAYTVRSHTDTALDWCKPMTANREILWLSGIHGHEITVPYDDFVFFSDLVRHHGENPTLQWLWDHVTFVVVPVICPWGLDHGSRVNANGVNLNRNFPASNWAVSGAGTNDYSGAAAGSEPETQAMMALVNAHKDALFAVNRHTMNAFSPTARYAYISSLIQTDRQAASEAFKALDGICKTNFDVFADLDLARNLFAVCDSTVTGTLDQWYNEQGVHGFLLEMSPYFNASHFPNADAILAQNINATVIGNFLFGFTQEPKAFSDELPTLVWEAGVVSSRGDNLSNNYRIRTKDAVQLPAGTVITIDNGYRYKVNTYSRWTSPTDFAMVENGSFMTDSFRVTGGSLYYRFSVASVSDEERVADDVPGTAAHLHMEIIESELAAVAYSGSYNDLQDTPADPAEALESLDARITAFEDFPLVKSYTAAEATSGTFELAFDRPLKAMRVLIEGAANSDVSAKSNATLQFVVGDTRPNLAKKAMYAQLISNAALIAFVETKLDRQMEMWVSDGSFGPVPLSNGWANARQTYLSRQGADGDNIFKLWIKPDTANGVSVTTGTTIRVYGLEA